MRLKCTVSRKFFIIFGLLLGLFFTLYASDNVSAANLGTSSFDLYYIPIGGSTYTWRNNILYGNTSPTIIDGDGGIRRYQFNTSTVTAGGNYASIHFETNIVASSYRNIDSWNPWVNLQYQNVLTCTGSGIGVVQKNLSYATTFWKDNNNEANNTLTFYGDIVLSGFNPNQTYNLVCAVGSATYSFIDPPGTSSAAVWFEQNPATISWNNDQSVALLQGQINQNNTIINQNQTIIDQNNQDRADLENTSSSAESSASTLGSNITSSSSNLITIIGNFIYTLLHPPSTNCVIDGDLGNMDLGDIDLCELDPPASFSIIGSFLLIGLLIPLVIACIWRFIRILRVVIGS